MARLMHITGARSVVKNLFAAKTTIALQMTRRFVKAGLFLQGKSQRVVPVEFGVLRNSAFTRVLSGFGFDTDVVVGYTANYAVYVHENLNAKHATGKIAKYLELPARENRLDILRILAGA